MLAKWPILILSAALAVVGGGSLAYISHEHAKERQISVLNEGLSSSLIDMQHQVESLNRRLADLSEPHPVPSKPAKPAPPRQPSKARIVARSAQPPREDPRFKEMQARLADQQKQIAGTREDLDKARDELGGKLDSTRDELSTSIAKSHDEVVELQKRGERSYYEFQLDKSKEFQRVGPIRLSLRKADLKHKAFNVAMMVDDSELQKKNVNLYEPVWINLGGETVELVVNEIHKDHIQGYLSEPKFKRNAPVRHTAGSDPNP
jgi:hypothetical protein